MSFDPYTPTTTFRQLDWPRGHVIYRTSRLVPGEATQPGIGMFMSAVFGEGTPYANHVIVATDNSPAQASSHQRVQSFEHMLVPSGTHVRYRSTPYTFPAIYPNGTAFFPWGSNARARLVMGRETSEYSTNPNTWLDDATIWNGSDPTTGPLEIFSRIAEAAAQNFEDGDGNSGRVGDYLSGQFITQDTIHNAITISAPGDLFYPIPPSVPSATLYAQWAAAKTWLIIRRGIEEWYGNILVRKTLEVRAQ